MNLPDDTMDGGRTRLVERVLVCYPRAETDEERRARVAKGLPRPTVSFVVSTMVHVEAIGGAYERVR